jgi:hypothetical protein
MKHASYFQKKVEANFFFSKNRIVMKPNFLKIGNTILLFDYDYSTTEKFSNNIFF